MIDNDNSIIESLDSFHFNEPHPIKLPSSQGKSYISFINIYLKIHQHGHYQHIIHSYQVNHMKYMI